MIMEEEKDLNGPGFIMKGDEVPSNYVAEPRADIATQYGAGLAAPLTGPIPAAPTLSIAAPNTKVKKKRGRPRKYGPDGSVVPLSPMPISASIPLSGDYSSWKRDSGKTGKSLKKRGKLDLGSQGGSYFAGESFIPHVITVNAGEDLCMKIISFSQQASRAICVLAANGSVSSVTLRQPVSLGGTRTYEGNFEILSLSGSFMPSHGGIMKSRTGGMSVALAGPDGRVFGGSIAGVLVAACSVQVVIGSFLPGEIQEQNPKKPKYAHNIVFGAASATLVSKQIFEVDYNGPNPSRTTPASSSFPGNNFASTNYMQGLQITDIDKNDALIGEDSGEHSHDVTG